MRGLWVGILRGWLLVLFLATPAFATNPPAGPPLPELIPKVRPTTRLFYGWQILVTGEVGALLATAAVVLPDQPLGSAPATAGFVVGMPLFAIGGPAVHWAHDDFTKGLISFGANVVLPLTGGFAGRALRCNETNALDDCASRGFLTGVAISAVVVPIIDALALGWQDLPVEDALSLGIPRLGKRPRESTLVIAPWSNFGKSGLFQVGLGGHF